MATNQESAVTVIVAIANPRINQWIANSSRS
eukprot:CAMPEP_0116557506 /NCGR_PEP_ID=MMETSP0397-20121206/9280_1 /TAXON_ID=216820 /ORGANISM="Cyclophora tenuis, Strain ECT3854" /LENGTH=30 /DNA_ID= /DNA_START= /DNA_END= /DNA_ORIENTATION=